MQLSPANLANLLGFIGLLVFILSKALPSKTPTYHWSSLIAALLLGWNSLHYGAWPGVIASGIAVGLSVYYLINSPNLTQNF